MHRVSCLAALLLLSSSAVADAPDAGFRACLAALRADAPAQRVPVAAFDAHIEGIELDPGVLESLDHQPEFVTPIWDYLAALVDEERVADGRRMLAAHRDTLEAVERRYGVDPETVVAVWGVESDFGQTFGKRPLLRSLATLSCAGRRQPFFRGELFAALRILVGGHVEPALLTGSWAGAFGHTQFMPSTFERIAVDFDGDGRRDLVGSVPDALASTAHFLQRAGWRRGQHWGFEVALPHGFDAANAGRRNKRPLSEWSARGVRRVGGGALADASTPADADAGLLLPAGRVGPAFLVLRNFDALYSYNAAESYALAIAVLSDRLRGRPGIAATWPTDDPGLSRAERRELQTLLAARGHDIGEIDGMVGSRTRTAIAAEQHRLGLDGDPRAGRRILDRLRNDPTPPTPDRSHP